jgi:hypothetical protein
MARSVEERIIDAETRGSGHLADGNAALERGDKAKAEAHFEKAQHWLDRANRLRGWD